MKISNLFLPLLLLTFSSVFAQTSNTGPAGSWTRISSSSEDFAISLPADGWIVSAEGGSVSIFRYGDNSTVSVSFTENAGGKQRFREQIRSFADLKPEPSYAEVGDFYIRQTYRSIKKKSTDKYTNLYLASSKGTYSISIVVKEAHEDLYLDLLSAIRIEGSPLYEKISSKRVPEKSIRASNLKSDDIVSVALNRPDSKQSKLTKSTVKYVEVEDDDDLAVNYSRSLLILRKNKAQYTEPARRDSISGTVVFDVTFSSDGSIGDIVLLKSLDGGLDKNAFSAAKKIKFIPAMVDGKPVDVVRRVVYSFNIF